MKLPKHTSGSGDINTILAGMVDRRRRIMWARFSSEDFHHNGSVEPFTQIGYPDRMASSMFQPSQFPPPYCMVLQGIMVLLDRDTSDAALASFERNVLGSLKVLSKVFEALPMSVMTSRADVDNLVNRETHEPTEFVTGKLYEVEPNLYIPPLVQFAFTLSVERSWVVPDFSGYVLFDGLMDHPVQ